MNLKNVMLTGMLLLSSFILFSQEIDTRLLKSYQESELTLLQETNKEKYELLVYALDNGIQIVNVGAGKDLNIKGTVKLPSAPFSFTDLGLKIEEMEQYYRIEGTENVLMVKSFSLLNRIKNGK